MDPSLMYSKHLSAQDVSNALGNQNIILPAGTARIGGTEYLVRTNSSPATIDALNDLPVHANNGAIVYMRDIAQVRDGYAVQTNIVRQNGNRSSFLTVLKNGKASTLDIVNSIIKAMPRVKADLPPALKITPLFDQSIFVRASINEVLREASIAAVLTAFDDSALSGKLAQHPDRLHLHSAFHSDLHLHHGRAGRNHQCHDSGRAGSGGRNTGGRRDG